MNKQMQARRIVANAVRSGELKRMPCVVCGINKSEGHHHDYSKPLDVIWLCRVHHEAEHTRMRVISGEPRYKRTKAKRVPGPTVYSLDSDLSSLVVLREYDVPEDKQLKITPPAFWLDKQESKTLELCQDADSGFLVIRPKLVTETKKPA